MAPANLVAILILCRGRCGLSRCISLYLVAIAVTDFLVIVNGCILNRIDRIYFRNSALSTTPGCKLTTLLIFATRDCSVWLTVAFTFDRFVVIGLHSLKTRYCTEKSALLVIGMVCSLSCIQNAPFYIIFKPLYYVDGVPWFCVIKSFYYTVSAWQAFNSLDHILTPILPFLLILLLNTLTVRIILVASRARRRLRSSENHGDTEMANRRRSIVLLFAISLSFLLLWVTHVIQFLYVRITGVGYFNSLDFNDPQYILQETTNMLQILSSCNNIFIYAVTQNKFREELKQVLIYPFTIFIAVLNRKPQ
ncbi:probable G-protein coupled receptor 139 [Hemiscyllium ocellatum]|uniref:probable G-protein coupled receptor 139 n=1 Tax=Hemiscyllium ocellatum TaxID=170820 RepID=UPI0029660497|nr:probable G-protein coupled receptor 139 [Hemiscyllium ocellatum]